MATLTDTDFWSLHEDAVARGETSYLDPQTGFVVFTKLGLIERGKCCGAGCRHCPFGHESVPVERRSRRIQQPAWLTDARPNPADSLAILFWSGGKDSFLAYRAMLREGRFNPVLLTTFDARTRMIAHQEFSIDAVIAQGLALGVPIIGVPLHAGGDYVEQLVPALDLVPCAAHLAFGDLHLELIRKWREGAFAANARTAAMALEFPLWNANYDVLLEDLAESGAACTISAITADLPGIEIGSAFDAKMVARLPEDVDPFGENGEFHTKIALGGAPLAG